MKTQHTPGPWAAYNAIGGRILKTWRVTQLANGKRTIASIHGALNSVPAAEEIANAHLVAAAPEMLQALQIAIRALQDNNIDEMMAGEFEILTDAVTKATGGY